MDRFTIKRKISDTLLGATYECSFNAPPLLPSLPALNPVQQHSRSSIAIKYSNLSTRERLETILNNEGDANQTAATLATLDDPERERRVVAALIASGGHDNVLQCYDQFTTADSTTGDECSCIVTEYCDGGDLLSYLLQSPKGLTETEVVKIMMQVTRGVRFLQSRLGLAHGDLSLENILLRNGMCKVADFGLATPLREKCYGRVGKVLYMAPEVVASQDSSRTGYEPGAADVWSLGVMFFVLLTKSRLVDVASSEDTRFVALTSHGVGPLLMMHNVYVSCTLVELLHTMLLEKPQQRPTVSQVLTTLHQLQLAHNEQLSRQTIL